MKNQEASSEQLDALMRTSWEELSQKEKLRYFQRAANAVKDRNRHSTSPTYSRRTGKYTIMFSILSLWER